MRNSFPPGLASWALPFFHPEKTAVLMLYAGWVAIAACILLTFIFLQRPGITKTTLRDRKSKSRSERLTLVFTAILFVAAIGATFLPIIIRPLRVFSEFPAIEETTLTSKGPLTRRELESVVARGANSQASRRLESEFYGKNITPLTWQTLNRGFFHHHHFILGPIQQYDLGRPVSELNLQYGLLNLATIHAIMKGAGGISYERYFRTVMAFYPVYLLILMALLILFVPNPWLVFSGMALALGALLACGYPFLVIAPGLNPFRHFLDLPVAFLFWCCLRERRSVFMMLGWLACLLAILNNSQTGFVLSLAWFGASLVVFIDHASLRRWRTLAAQACGLVLATALYVAVSHIGKDLLSGYYLKGFLAFPIKTASVIIILGAVGMAYGWMARIWKQADRDKYLALFLFFYAQGVLIYGLWGGTVAHFMNFGPIFALSAIVAWHAGASASIPSPRIRTLVNVLLVIGGTAALAGGLHKFLVTRAEYEAPFDTHRTYSWKMPAAGFRSTMDPAPFVETIALIQKYSSRPGLFIISKYENLLMPLARRYSELPHLELSWFMTTEKEKNLAIGRILAGKPDYLFVDRDIEHDWSQDVVPSGNPYIGQSLHRDSLWRAERYSDLRDVFDHVKAGYSLVEERGLLGVWRRM